MKDIAILAASYIGPEGHGNDRTGLQPWLAPLNAAFGRGELADLHWSLLFTSDPSRFARMDLMCRLGLMAAELLEAGFDDLPQDQRDRVGVCIETASGCLITDVQFLRTPRPTLFTYTLPSTVIGEVCIRFRLRGPVLCLISPTADPPEQAVVEAVEWLQQSRAETVLCIACEAVERDSSSLLHRLQGLPSEPWHACALLLGRTTGRARERRLTDSSMKNLCFQLCSRPKDPC